MCDRFPRKFDVQTSYKPSNYVLGLIFVGNIKFPQATYHTIVPSTEELYYLNSDKRRTRKRNWLARRTKLVILHLEFVLSGSGYILVAVWKVKRIIKTHVVSGRWATSFKTWEERMISSRRLTISANLGLLFLSDSQQSIIKLCTTLGQSSKTKIHKKQ